MGEEGLGSVRTVGLGFGQEESGMFLAGREGAGLSMGDVFQCSAPGGHRPAGKEGTEGGAQVPSAGSC